MGLGFNMSSTLLTLFMRLPNSRTAESEGESTSTSSNQELTRDTADYIGLKLSSAACFDPSAAVGLWERMDAAEHAPGSSGGLSVDFLSTHPASKRRMESIRGWLPEVRDLSLVRSSGLLTRCTDERHQVAVLWLHAGSLPAVPVALLLTEVAKDPSASLTPRRARATGHRAQAVRNHRHPETQASNRDALTDTGSGSPASPTSLAPAFLVFALCQRRRTSRTTRNLHMAAHTCHS